MDGKLAHLYEVHQKVSLGSKVSVWSTSVAYLGVVVLCLVDVATDKKEVADKHPYNMWVIISLNSIFNDVGMAIAEGLVPSSVRRMMPCPSVSSDSVLPLDPPKSVLTRRERNNGAVEGTDLGGSSGLQDTGETLQDNPSSPKPPAIEAEAVHTAVETQNQSVVIPAKPKAHKVDILEGSDKVFSNWGKLSKEKGEED
jgi:hypothetical protein